MELQERIGDVNGGGGNAGDTGGTTRRISSPTTLAGNMVLAADANDGVSFDHESGSARNGDANAQIPDEVFVKASNVGLIPAVMGWPEDVMGKRPEGYDGFFTLIATDEL